MLRKSLKKRIYTEAIGGGPKNFGADIKKGFRLCLQFYILPATFCLWGRDSIVVVAIKQ